VTERKELQLQLDELSEKEGPAPRRGQKETTPDILLGSSKAMQEVRELIRKFASRGGTVLIRGESGTGKELVARALHYCGRRARKPFKEVNSAGGVPDQLVYSELFGHEKGAFTGAERRRIGKFEEADGGTLFLDEIGDMPLSTQVMLLKVLEQRCFERLGGNETLDADVRVICATNRNLEEAIEKGGFRADLYYRLNHIEITIPPLRERASDIAELAEHFLARANRVEKRQVAISDEARKLLKIHSWPGNVRELRHAIERAVSVCEGETILPKDLPPAVRLQAASSLAEDAKDKEKRLVEIVDDFERKLILDALEQSKWKKTDAAKLLGINVKLLDYRIEKYGLPGRSRPSQNRPPHPSPGGYSGVRFFAKDPPPSLWGGMNQPNHRDLQNRQAAGLHFRPDGDQIAAEVFRKSRSVLEEAASDQSRAVPPWAGEIARRRVSNTTGSRRVAGWCPFTNR
jgi:DNA-binding NtrC family response regulator